jgi:hypothetical protein
MTKQKLGTTDEFWSNLSEWMRGVSATEKVACRSLSARELELCSQNGRTLLAKYCPENELRPLNYSLDGAFPVELQLVQAGKTYFRYEGVNYCPETLGRKMISELHTECE